MRKICLLCLMLWGLSWLGGLTADRVTLNEDVIRLHVVANSDSREDQAVKLLVRDQVRQVLEPLLARCSTAEEARRRLEENLPLLKQTAERTMEQAGKTAQAAVTLCRESFDTRHYDTFSLPAGVYDALRIQLGEGKGKNWWCVVFPALCGPGEVTAVAAGAGFPESLGETLEEAYEVRFFLLDALGRLENLLVKK